MTTEALTTTEVLTTTGALTTTKILSEKNILVRILLNYCDLPNKQGHHIQES